MSDAGTTTASGPVAARAQQRTLRERRRRVWRNVGLVVVVTIVMVVLTQFNRNEQAIRSCQQRMEYARKLFQDRQDQGLPALEDLPLPGSGAATPEERQRLADLRNHTIYNMRYSGQTLLSRQIGVCWCRRPHTRLFRSPGRYVIILENGKYEWRWMDETEFRERADDLGISLAPGPE